MSKLLRSGQVTLGNLKAWQEKMGALQEQVQEEIEQTNAKIMEDYERRKGNLVELALNLSRLSPTSAVTHAAAGLAGTGPRSHKRFLSDLQAYRIALQEYIREQKGDEMIQMAQRFARGEFLNTEPLDLSGFPVFREHPEPLGKSIQQALPDIVLLTAGAIMFLTLAFLSFLHCDVR